MVVASPTVKVVEKVYGAHEGTDEKVHHNRPREGYQEIVHEDVNLIIGDT